MLPGQAGLGTLRAACLEEVRSVIRLSGPGLVHFLQGIVTNDVASLEPPSAAPLYTCILNAQGRHLHDLLLHRTADAVPTVLADADRRGAPDLLRLLRRYRLRQRIDIDDASQQYRVWARYGGGTAAQAAAAAPSWPPDPRLPLLGLRAVLPAAEEDSGGGGGILAASWQDHRRWRILHGVAEGDGEIPTGEVVPLEYNIDGLHGISFTKGCYVGQELMARTHFKGVVRKRLLPFVLAGGAGSAAGGGDGASQQRQQALAGELGVPAAALAAADNAAAGTPPAVQPGAAVYAAQPGGKRKPVGVVRVVDGALGLAVLRLAAVEAARAAGQPLLVGEGDAAAELHTWRPSWWPQEWGTEDAAGAAQA